MEGKANNDFYFAIIIRDSQDPIREKCIDYCKKNPSIHFYSINADQFDEDIEKIKNVNLNMVACSSFFAKYIPVLKSKFPTIQWIHSFAAGVERFCKLDFMKSNKNIIISNSKGAYSEAFGEAGIAAMMYFSYNIANYIEAMKNKEYKRFSNSMLDNKILLIIGYGNNGICLAKRAKLAFNMKVFGVVRTPKDNTPGKEYTENIYDIKNLPAEIINKADFVYATLPSTSETVNFFNKDFFCKMNKNAVFLNIGRGNAVVEDDIIYALENDLIRGAALDVTQNEPINKDSKLYNIPPSKLLLTNHSIGNVKFHQQKTFNCLIENLENYLKNGKPINIVDIEREY